MKKFIILTLICIYLPQAQTVREAKSDKAILFELSGNESQLVNNYIYGLGYRWYFSNSWSVALSLGFNSGQFDKMEDDTNVNTENLDWGINPSLRYNFSSNSNIIGYIGTDLMYFNSESIERFTDIENINTVENYDVGLFLGADWFFTKNICVSAQYRLSYGRSFSSEKLNDVIISENEDFITQLGMSNMKLGLSIFIN